MSKVVVTRHEALVEYLKEINLVSDGVEVISHATPEAVTGKDVIGVLPLRLVALAKSITEVPLALPAELRGCELTIEQVRKYAGEPVIYSVTVQS